MQDPITPQKFAVRVNPKYYNLKDFKDVMYISTVENLDAVDDNGFPVISPMTFSRYCEHLIRSGVNTRKGLYPYIKKADLAYCSPATGDNLLNIAILSGNFTAVDALLLFKCPQDIKNDSGFSSADFVSFDSCSKTVKGIFKKYSDLNVKLASLKQEEEEVPEVTEVTDEQLP